MADKYRVPVLLRMDGTGKAKPGDLLRNRQGQTGKLIDVRLYPFGPAVDVEVDGQTLLGSLDDWGLELQFTGVVIHLPKT